MKRNITISILVFVLLISSIVTAAEYYTVRTGDTLWTISQKTGISIEEIASKNKLSNPENLYIGQKIVIGRDSNNRNNYIRYTVKTGDLLWKIAQKYNVEIQEIIDLNKMTSPYYIYIGQTLLIPGENNNNNNNSSSSNIQGSYFYYSVKPGDILWNIAQKYGTTVQKLVELNDIKNSYDLYVGRKLIVPLRETRQSSKFNNINRTSLLNNYYRVLRNDTLANIAEYYNIPEEEIRALNNLGKNGKIYTGQRLLMPVNPALFVKHKIYKVKPGGEYIFDIAFENGISIKSILKANYLKNQNTRFEEGTTILIPLDKNSKATWIEYENGKPINSWF